MVQIRKLRLRSARPCHGHMVPGPRFKTTASDSKAHGAHHLAILCQEEKGQMSSPDIQISSCHSESHVASFWEKIQLSFPSLKNACSTIPCSDLKEVSSICLLTNYFQNVHYGQGPMLGAPRSLQYSRNNGFSTSDDTCGQERRDDIDN